VLQLRLVNDADSVKSILELVVAGRAAVEYLSVHSPARLFTVNGFDQCVVRFTTDIPYLSHWGKPLLIGPGSIFQAHTDGEYVSKRELRKAVTLYAGLTRSLLRTADQRAGQVAEGALR
jgi:acetylornithine deacetylase